MTAQFFIQQCGGGGGREARDGRRRIPLHPNSHKGTNLTEAGGIGYIVVDTLDTGPDAKYPARAV